MLYKNYAFIDSQNLNLGIEVQGWKLDYQKFRIYLKEKYNVHTAFLFIGFIPGNEPMYSRLRDYGFDVVFRPALEYKKSKFKNNVEPEMVLYALKELEFYDKAVIVTGDGDYYCLIDFLEKRRKLLKLLVPNYSQYSHLLNFHAPNKIDFMNNLKNKLEYKK